MEEKQPVQLEAHECLQHALKELHTCIPNHISQTFDSQVAASSSDEVLPEQHDALGD